MASIKSYSDYLKKVSGLIGIPVSGFNSAELTFLAGYFGFNIKNAWEANSFVDLCPYGEARFAGNLGYYPNDLTKSSYWTATAVTPTTGTSQAFANPADGRYTSTKVLETSATSTHSELQAYDYLPNTGYLVSGYARPNARNFIQGFANDGVNDYTCFFDLGTGVTGTPSSLVTSYTISQCSNGYWMWTIQFTSATNAGTGSYGFRISTDGSTTSYAGDATKGVYAWGNILMQTTYASPTLTIIPWEQLGERVIEAIFQVWKDSPASTILQRPQAYEIVPDGIQIVGSPGYNYGTIYYSLPNGYIPSQFPVYLVYRRQCPNYEGDDYDVAATYAVDEQILYKDSDGVSNYYKCTVATSAGQNPENAPTMWELLEIPGVLFDATVFAAYADWLRMDGQMDKAAAMDARAQQMLDHESDKQERQEGWFAVPMKIATHVTSQARR